MQIDNFKNIFPFKIGTTSYIFDIKENNLITNVEYLKDSFDVIQLLYFGKNYLNEVMSSDILNTLYEIKKNSPISFIIHLPIDFNLLDPKEKDLKKSLNIIKDIIDKTTLLDPKAYILHIDRFENNKHIEIDINKSSGTFEKVLREIKNCITKQYQKILIENTNYNLIIYKDIINTYNYNVCMDIGHLWVNQFNLNEFIDTFNNIIKVVHVHGFQEKLNHTSLKIIPESIRDNVFKFIKNYNGTVIIEVFNYNDLIESINVLKKFQTNL